jgi:hypothetical protein
MRLEEEQELGASRYTKLDGRIKELCDGSNRVDLKGLTFNRERIQARLERLKTLGLCVYKDGAYRLPPRWDENLKANGRYNAFLKAREGLIYTDAAELRVYSGKEGRISGKVTKILRTDGDASDNHAVIVETPDGKAWFVPLFKPPEIRNGKTRGTLREGAYITLETYTNQKGRLTPVIFKSTGSRGRTGLRPETRGRRPGI